MKPIYWVITVLAAGAIGAGAIYYANQPALDVGPVAVHHAVKSNMVVASPSAASSSPIDISGWKTYTNSHAGFEIKFPQGWSMPAASDAGPWRFQSVNFSKNIHGIGLPPEGNLWVDLAQGICNNPSADFINESGTEAPNISEKTACQNSFQIVLGFWNNDPQSEADKQILNSILGTFQVNQQADTSGTSSLGSALGWKTYTNSQYGFSFDYPVTLYLKNPVNNVNNPSYLSFESMKEEFFSNFDLFPDGADPVVDTNLEGYAILIWYDSNSDNLSFAQWAKTFIPNSKVSADNLEIAGIPAQAYTVYLPGLGGYSYEGILFKRNGIMYDAKLYYHCQNECYMTKFRSVYDQLLSTFKFTN